MTQPSRRSSILAAAPILKRVRPHSADLTSSQEPSQEIPSHAIFCASWDADAKFS